MEIALYMIKNALCYVQTIKANQIDCVCYQKCNFLTIVNQQLGTEFLYSFIQYVYYIHVHFFSSTVMLIIRRTDCINTASGIVTLEISEQSKLLEYSLLYCNKRQQIAIKTKYSCKTLWVRSKCCICLVAMCMLSHVADINVVIKIIRMSRYMLSWLNH